MVKDFLYILFYNFHLLSLRISIATYLPINNIQIVKEYGQYGKITKKEESQNILKKMDYKLMIVLYMYNEKSSSENYRKQQ